MGWALQGIHEGESASAQWTTGGGLSGDSALLREAALIAKRGEPVRLPESEDISASLDDEFSAYVTVRSLLTHAKFSDTP